MVVPVVCQRVVYTMSAATNFVRDLVTLGYGRAAFRCPALSHLQFALRNAIAFGGEKDGVEIPAEAGRVARATAVLLPSPR